MTQNISQNKTYDIDDIDIELKLLSGKKLIVDNIEITPFKIGEIIDVGFGKYSQMLNIFYLKIEEMLEIDVNNEEMKDLRAFDILLNSGMEDFTKFVLEAIRIILKCNSVVVNIEKQNIGLVYGDGNIDDTIVPENIHLITRDNWENICKCVKMQNCYKIDDEKEGTDDTTDLKTLELLKRRSDVRKQLEKIKSNSSDEEPLTFTDLISILSANGNYINILNVWELTFYQFNNQFARMKMLEDYDISIRSLLAGAKAEDVNIVHWMSKINK